MRTTKKLMTGSVNLSENLQIYAASKDLGKTA